MKQNEVDEVVSKVIDKVECYYPLIEISTHHHPTSFGYSVYVELSMQKFTRFLACQVRVSDHSVGVGRLHEDFTYQINELGDIDDLIDKLAHSYNVVANGELRSIPKGYNEKSWYDYNLSMCSDKVRKSLI